jgi:hypothetical protein
VRVGARTARSASGVRRAEQRGVRARRGRARDQGQLRELDVSVCALVHVHGVRSADQEVRAVRRMAGARRMLVPSGTGRRRGEQQKRERGDSPATTEAHGVGSVVGARARDLLCFFSGKQELY